jgi:hypothetical protein
MKERLMRTCSIVATIVGVLAPSRPAQACDPHCGRHDRRVSAVIFGAPAVLLTTFAAPALAKALLPPGPGERAPGYWTGVAVSLLASGTGLALTYAAHALVYPDPDNGGPPLPTIGEEALLFALPPLLLGATASALTFTVGRSTGSATPAVTSMPGGLVLTLAGTF